MRPVVPPPQTLPLLQTGELTIHMRGVAPSLEQERAILSPGNLLVRAGAGSGKTEVLARRLVALIAGDIEGAHPLAPEQIAAITFTEKATYDMRERIAQVLEERITEEPPGERFTHLVRARRLLPLAHISTIHAFCQRILAENPLEAGLAPGFEVIDEYESRAYRERVCEQALVDAVRGNDRGAAHLMEARGMRGGIYREGALDILMRIVGELERFGYPPEWIVEATEAGVRRCADSHGNINELARKLAKLIDELLRARDLTAGAEAKIAPLRRGWTEMRHRLTALDENHQPGEFEVVRDICDATPDARGRLQQRVIEIRELATKGGGRFGLAGALIEAYGTHRAIEPATEVGRLVADIARKLAEAKERDGVVTFDDLLTRTQRMLSNNATVARRYRATLRAMLVDEYQDTDPIQDAIVDLLTDPSGDRPAPQLFIVGDEKQSIYRFRGADVTVFNRERRSTPTPVPLRENRRSTHNILNFVNAVTGYVMRASENGGEAAKPYRVEWTVHHELKPIRETANEPAVEYIAAVTGDGSATQKRGVEAGVLAHRIKSLIESGAPIVDPRDKTVRPTRYGDIAILMRAFTDVAIYERALVDAGIPCYTVKGRGFFGCTEVIDLVELLTAVNDAGDSPALAAALRSPLFALSDNCLLEIALHLRERQTGVNRPATLAKLFEDEAPDFAWLAGERDEALHAWRVLRELRDIRARVPIVEVIERALELTGFEAVMIGLPQGPQRVANLRKLVELARGFEARRFFSFHDFIIYLRRLIADPPLEPQAQILGESENVVRLMTVHQAKGLEFPVVIIADMGRGAAPRIPPPLLSPRDGLLICDTDGSAQDEIPNPSLEEYRDELRDQDDAESARLLYVAMTRARDRLILSEGAGADIWTKKVREFFKTNGVDAGAFVDSGASESELTIGNARIVRRRADLIPIATGLREPAQPPTPGAELFTEIARRRLAFAPPSRNELVMSPTALADFDRCPRQYQLRHELGLPEGVSITTSIAGAGGDAAERGTVAHAVLERLDFSANAHILEGEIAALVEKFSTASELGAHERAAIVRDLYRYVSANRMNLASQREVPFFMRVADDKATLFIRGQIDVLIDDGNRVLVRDYKYARAAEESDAYQVQMECYALAAMDAYPARDVSAEIVFLRDEAVAITVKLPPADEIRRRLLALAGAILEASRSNEFPKKPASPAVCRALRCGYVPRCWGR
jgi:ATP-dependent helicase/nuclease subunit A